MENEKNLLPNLLRVIGEECLRQADSGGYAGSRDFHIESIRRVEDDGPAWNFEVVTWSEQSEDPENVERVSLVELLSLLGRAVTSSALESAADVIRSNYEI